MFFLAYLIGFIGCSLFSFLIYLLNEWTNIALHGYTILFIIPLGGLITGLVAANILARGKKIFQIKIIKRDILIAVLFGLCSYFLIDYLSYYTTYINEDSDGNIDIINSLSEKEGYDSLKDYISFIDYMDIINSSSAVQFRYKGVVKIGDSIEMGKTATVLSYILQIIGVILGAAVTMITKRDESPYCDNCKKYKKIKVLKKINTEDIEESLLSKKMSELYEYSGNMTKIKGLLNSFHDLDDNSLQQGQMYLTISLIYCDNCLNGDLIIAFYVVKEDEHSIEKSFLVELQGNVTPLLNELGNSNQGYDQDEKITKKTKIHKKTNNEKKNA